MQMQGIGMSASSVEPKSTNDLEAMARAIHRMAELPKPPIVPFLNPASLPRTTATTCGYLFTQRRRPVSPARQMFKRVFDLATASALFLLTWPILLIATIAVKLTSRGPVIFRQERVGRNGHVFSCYKFRTMYMENDPKYHRQFAREWIYDTEKSKQEEKGMIIYKLTRDPRITTVGRLLRQFSIDELPQIFNVLKGDMSMVGPRPPLSYEVSLYRNWHLRRLDVMPGITGLWQVSGRNLLTFEEMVRLDLQYIENWSVWLEIKILLKTVWVVLRGMAY
jgi:exopolysaccharide biosynthesis polyprenyl glycosylphosphotransferase